MKLDSKFVGLTLIICLLVVLFLWSCSKINQPTGKTAIKLRSKPYNIYHPLEALWAPRQPRLLCWILTVDSPDHATKRRAVNETWGQRCDKLLFVHNGSRLAEFEDEITLPLDHEGRDLLWRKVVEAFKFIYKHHLDQFDWFMKADDDTYVIVDNLKRFLSKRSPQDLVYYGYKFKPLVNQGYMSGGSGYVLSRSALKLVVEEALEKKRTGCQANAGSIEDVEMGRCLESVGVEAGDSRGPDGLPTFLPLSPFSLLAERQVDEKSWFYQYAFYEPPKPGKQCCSRVPISFHYIDPNQMYLIDWLLYNVKGGY